MSCKVHYKINECCKYQNHYNIEIHRFVSEILVFIMSFPIFVVILKRYLLVAVIQWPFYCAATLQYYTVGTRRRPHRWVLSNDVERHTESHN